MASRAEQLAAAERKAAEAAKRVRQLKAAAEMAEARKLVSITKGQRAEDTRRKVLVGAMVLAQMEASPEFAQRMTGALDGYLTRPDDRALFGLPAQKRLWPELTNAQHLGFTLYGGTGIALRLGHRDSVDFDFFSENPLDREAIKAAFPFMGQAETLQDQGNTWVVFIPSGNPEEKGVKVSFFGTIAFGRVGEPDFTDDGVLQVASFDDLMATKVKVVPQRAEAKDYRDVSAMVNAGVSLSRGLASARQLYGPNFQPSESLKALVYFNDGDLKTLTADEKKTLVDAVKVVRDLPDVALRSKSLSGLSWKDLSIMDERITGLVNLEKRAGAALTFWQHATEAIKVHGANGVDWADVERKTVIESISEHGQPPSEVADVICQHSPGAVSKARQDKVRALVDVIAPELQAQYAVKLFIQCWEAKGLD